MGKPTGFLEFTRQLPLDIAPAERTRDWNEFHEHADPKMLQQQGARCMDCGVPFCHTGSLLEGMASGCPLNNLIPEWNDLVYRGLWREALDRLHKTNNFPEFTGRVCPAPCEGSCVLGINEPAVTIKSIECAIVDKGFQENWIQPEVPAVRTGKKVAVVGSGPAGLAAAAQLNRAGHWVTVFERADRIGGLLMYGIPNMKLDKSKVQRRVDLLAAEGIKFITGCEVGVNFPAEQLLEEYQAVILCGGATKPRDLPRRGAICAASTSPWSFCTPTPRACSIGIVASVQWPVARKHPKTRLHRPLSTRHSPLATRHSFAPRIKTSSSSAAATRVRTASAPRCATVVAVSCSSRFCPGRRSRGPGTIPGRNGPRSTSSTMARRKRPLASATIQGSISFRPRNSSATASIGSRNCTPFASSGSRITARSRRVRFRAANRSSPPSSCSWPWAFSGRKIRLLDKLGVEKDARSNAKAEHGRFQTNLANVFVAGDMRRGQSLVVWAINEGRGAARECDRYLMGETVLP